MNTDITITSIAPPSTIYFYMANKEVGRLEIKDGKLKFTGDTDESASILFKHVTNVFNERTRRHIEALEKIVRTKGMDYKYVEWAKGSVKRNITSQ
jgi:hypothetical protein